MHNERAMEQHCLNLRTNEPWARAAREVRVYTNERMEANLPLYRRHGFIEIAKRRHPSRPGQVLVDMVRRLDSPTSRVGSD